MELSFFYQEGGWHLFVGGPEFFEVFKGGDQFVFVGQRGGQNFFRVKEGETKILFQVGS